MRNLNKRRHNAPTLMDLLTPRQFRVTILVASGLKDRQIAKSLRMSQHALKNCLRDILDRAGCQNRTELVLRHVYESQTGLYDEKELTERLAESRKWLESGLLKTRRRA